MYAALRALDLGLGATVVEAGTGSRAMTLHLSRAGVSVCVCVCVVCGVWCISQEGAEVDMWVDNKWKDVRLSRCVNG